ncbi:MAG: hypothetical protein ACNA7I_08550 [Candidatus Methanoperedens sp.]
MKVALPPDFLKRRLFECDFTKFPAIFYLAVIFLISRIPFINLGFSAFTNPTDQDVLAVVNSAYLLRYFDVYTVSRFPGYPVYEIINSLFIGGGWIATNTATMAVSFICILLFAKILTYFKIQNKAIPVLTFAFIPVIWINSTVTIDYMWGLMFILLAFHLLFKEKYNYSAIAISLAIGTRLTSVFMLIPLFYWMLYTKTDIKTIYTYLVITIVGSILSYSPVLYKYGFGLLNYYPREIPFNEVLYGITTQLISIPTLIVLIIAFISVRNIPKGDSTYNLGLLIVFIYSLLYIYHPSKPAYLIPVIPWGLILLNKLFSKYVVGILCVMLILNGIVSVDIQKGDTTDSFIKISDGSVLKNYEERKSTEFKSKEYMDSLKFLFEKSSV